MNVAGFIGLNASLELLLRHGQRAIGRRVLEITDLACERLTAAGAVIESSAATCLTPAASFRSASPAATPTRLRKELHQRGVVVSCRAGACASALTPTTMNRIFSA